MTAGRAASGVVPVEDAGLRWRRLGHGERTVIAAHQGPGGPPRPLWLRMLAEVPGLNVLSLELRGTDGSPRSHEDMGDRWYERWAADVARVADVLGETSYVYAGASHGAVVGWHLALGRPPGLRALVSVVGAPHGRGAGPGRSSGWEQRKAALHDRPPTSDPLRLRRRNHGHSTLLDEEPEPLIDQIRLFLSDTDANDRPDHEESSPCL